ncbi:hypothetical protein FKN01_30295 [Streptomyces sp. 130]|uniref:hypothetical protein n=1 Tax=Streptomyces sp. 130 TaxID=2591006 RepID=UPI00117C3669|nr:hypothetical protein [Streptomyces sp. 130]TRV72369.1 hypothetical protein FKN01_30295 [Streptomyces sp. 130]
MAKSRARNALLIGFTGLAAALLGVAALTSAQAAPHDLSTAVPLAVADGEMPYSVEDFAYPGADALLEQRGITLKRGDGHIVLTDITSLGECRDPENIMVESRKGNFCFRTNAKAGYLTLELPDTFSLWTQKQPVRATLTAEGESTVVSAPANSLTGVGESGDTGLRSVLVELRVTG